MIIKSNLMSIGSQDSIKSSRHRILLHFTVSDEDPLVGAVTQKSKPTREMFEAYKTMGLLEPLEPWRDDHLGD